MVQISTMVLARHKVPIYHHRQTQTGEWRHIVVTEEAVRLHVNKFGEGGRSSQSLSLSLSLCEHLGIFLLLVTQIQLVSANHVASPLSKI